ncbi:MAG: vanadium-dependent haloperoxidase [Myxococcota bacterium]
MLAIKLHDSNRRRLSALYAAAGLLLTTVQASADVVTDWNEIAVKATKGFNGISGTGVTLDSNLSSRVHAIEGRAVFDAANAVLHFSPASYAYVGSHSGSAEAAVAQAAHDVLLGLLPAPASDPAADPRWAQTRDWLDASLTSTLEELGVTATDDGVAAGQAAAAAALAARRLDNSAPVTTYGAALTPATNPGIGLWRQSNAAAVAIDPATGAPTGFDAAGAVIQGRPGIGLNWRDVTPFSLTTFQKAALVADVPLPPAVGSSEYEDELEYVRTHGEDSAHPGLRTPDQTAQALYYKQDAEIFVFEAARIASKARGLGLAQNARLFALIANAVADARIAAFASKYEQKFWRPITALNANPDGSVTNGYADWRPLAATPSHPSNTSGHSASGAAGFEVLRAFLGVDRILPDGSPATLTTLPWLVGTNSGTGNVTTRAVGSFSQAQLENGASRLYLGVHYGFDNYQGQRLGLAVADEILLRSSDPAVKGLRIRLARVRQAPASLLNIRRTLLSRPDLYGYFGQEKGSQD